MTFARALAVENLVIVGMEALWAGCDGLDAFDRMIYQAETHAPTFPGPSGDALLARAARGALVDAGTRAGERSEVILARGAATQAVRHADWDWASGLTDLSGSPEPLAAALEEAAHLLASGQADVVVFAAAAGLPGTSVDVPRAESVGFGFDRAVHGWRFGEGSGAVAIMRRDAALAAGRRIYAGLLSGAASQGTASQSGLPVPPAIDAVRAACSLALEGAGVTPEQIGYAETFASGLDALDAIEIAGLVQTYRHPGSELQTALGSAQANTGYLGAAAGLAGLIRAALSLYHRMIPAVPGWTAPKLPALWRNAPFHIPTESRPWFASGEGSRRLAAVNVLGSGGGFAHLILSEPHARSVEPVLAAAFRGAYLFPLAGSSLEELTAELHDLRQALMFAPQPERLAAERFEDARERAEARYGVAVVGRDTQEIAREVDLALNALPQAFEKGAEWQTPLGSCCAPAPVGGLGSVALVYPGAFNSYPGVGKDLFRLFPALYEDMTRITADLGSVIRERLLYPRSLAALTAEEQAGREAALLADPVAMLNSGTALAVMYTYVLREIFGLRPSAAFGYSLGETSMMYASGVWTQGDEAAARLAQSGAFRVRLAGPQNAVRAFWGLSEAAEPGDVPLWSNYLVMTTPEKAREALISEQRVYMTHVNTPRQVVIGGDPEACKRVIAALRCSALQAPFDYALHCAPIRSELEELSALHDWPVEQAPGLRMYSAADYEPVPLPYNRKAIARQIAHMLTEPLDFPRLVRRVYADGARVFIEAGAGSNCARWIDETLKGEPHLAISMNRRGTDDHASLIRTLARLHAHRVPVDFAALYRPVQERVNA